MWIRFFFSTNNGKIYMGSWDRATYPTTYTYDELLPAGSAKAGTPLAATAWDLNTTVGYGFNFADDRKRARLFYLDPSGKICERVYAHTTWSAGTLDGLNVQAQGTYGMSAISFFRDDVENVRLYFTTPSGQLQEYGWGAFGDETWSEGVSFSEGLQDKSPISFLNTKTWSNQDPNILGFIGDNNQIHDIKWDATWSTGTFAKPLSDSSGVTNGGYSFSAAAWKVDPGTPIVNLFWCGDGGSGGSLGTLYRASYTSGALAAPTAISFQQEPHSHVLAVAATNGIPPHDNHFFAWGDSTGTPTFIHYSLSGDFHVLNLKEKCQLTVRRSLGSQAGFGRPAAFATRKAGTCLIVSERSLGAFSSPMKVVGCTRAPVHRDVTLLHVSLVSASPRWRPSVESGSSAAGAHARRSTGRLRQPASYVGKGRSEWVLRKLWWGFHDHEADIVAALAQDLRKAGHESLQSDGIWLKNATIDVINGLDKWIKEDKLDVDLLGKLSAPTVRKEPMGVVLIIGAYNYPFQLTFGPMLGAIAAGNCVIVKPSEVSSASAAVLTNIITESLDPDAFAVVNGAIPETTKLLEQKYDKICYTGNGVVGRIVAAAAAKHLTPMILELGGLNPCIITKNADAKLAARRICWGKALNAGQVCLAPNYVLVPSSKEAEFVAAISDTWRKFYPEGMQASADLARLVNNRHFNRIKKMLDESSGEVKVGGCTDEKEKYIDLTLVKVKDENDALMRDEIFGPVLPYLVVDDLDDQIEFVNRVSDTPLALYPFTNDKKEAEYNKFGFEQFSHHRTTARQAGNWFEALLDARYPPYLPAKIAQFRALLEKKPNFTRDGKVRASAASWLGWLLTLGGGDSKTIVIKYAATIFGLVYLKNQLDAKKRL
ncbi:Omega-crystallin [Drechslerella dactyloides]|uniref:Omega-crystallin n=1 Tax=Drechslerella dactyloides TaxID=74499 RepID=A0AAD6IV06_DREDA|nr:Omega-crystallin [Drechslerella dactyloides]